MWSWKKDPSGLGVLHLFLIFQKKKFLTHRPTNWIPWKIEKVIEHISKSISFRGFHDNRNIIEAIINDIYDKADQS